MPNTIIPSRVAQAVSSARLVGGVFTVMGVLVLFPTFNGPLGFGFYAQLLSALTAMILIGPGVWYFVAAMFLNRGQSWVVRIAQYVAVGQCASMILAFVLGRFISSRYSFFFAAPGIMAVAQAPALIATIVQMRRAAREPSMAQGHGFAVKVAPADRMDVIPVVSSTPAEASPSDIPRG